MAQVLQSMSWADGPSRSGRVGRALPALRRWLTAIAIPVVVGVCAGVPVHAQMPTARTAVMPPVSSEASLGNAGRDGDLRLPGGFVNPPPGLWQQYRLYIIVASFLMLLQTGLIVTLLIQRTRRLRDQSALEEIERRYADASAAGAVGVWDWNFNTGEIYVDPVLKAILGFSPGELTTGAADWVSRVHPLDLEAVTARAQACIEGRVNEYEVEHRMIHKDGSVRWFLSRGSLVRLADGRPHHMLGTKVDITERKCAEESNREKEAALRANNLEIQDLAGRLIASQEVERARIARELHDDLSQHLAGLSIALSGLKRQVAAEGSRDLVSEVASLQKRTIGLSESVRLLSHDLHPSVLGHAGLVPALADHCAALVRGQRAVVSFSSDGDFSATSPDAALCLYRVAQEALRNVVTHAGPCRAEVRLRRVGYRAELTVADDGRGFEIVPARKNTHKGLGLVSITERVRLAGGSVSFVTELNKGTRVRVEVPMDYRAIGAATVPTGPFASFA